MPVFYPRCRAVLEVIFDGFADESRDSEVFVIDVVPKTCRITRNSYEQADSWSITFNALDLPIDPQLIRAGAAAIYLYQAQGATQRVVKKSLPAAKDATRVSQELRLENVPVQFDERPCIAGLFDDADLDLSDEKLVTISGQDYTDFFIKQQWKPLPNGRARRIPSGDRLDRIIGNILDEVDQEGRMRLVVENVDRNTLPTVGRNETRANQRGIPVQTDTSYWDVMYSMAIRHGCLLYVRGLDVVLTREANHSDRLDPRVKRMAWGRNLEQMRLTRHLGKLVSPTIVIRSYDPKTKRTIEVDYPPGGFSRIKQDNVFGAKGKHTNIKKSGGGKTKTGKDKKVSIKKSEEYQIIPVNGITDPEVLREAARLRYNRLSRAEREMTISTRDLRDLDGDDMLNLFAGDAVRIEFDEFNVEILQNDRVSDAEKVTYLVNKGFGQQVAVALVKHWDKLRFIDRPFRVKEVSYDYDVDDGIRIEMTVQDYIVVNGQRTPDRQPRRATREERLGARGYSEERETALRRQFPR